MWKIIKIPESTIIKIIEDFKSFEIESIISDCFTHFYSSIKNLTNTWLPIQKLSIIPKTSDGTFWQKYFRRLWNEKLKEKFLSLDSNPCPKKLIKTNSSYIHPHFSFNIPLLFSSLLFNFILQYIHFFSFPSLLSDNDKCVSMWITRRQRNQIYLI